MKRKNMLACDIGTSSVRLLQGSYDGTKVELSELERFYHIPIKNGKEVIWNLYEIYQKLAEMIKKASSVEKYDSISLDSWGTDIVAVNTKGELLTNGVATQDARFRGLKEEFFLKVSSERIYDKTGIQFLDWNTLYLLYSIMKQKPELVDAIDCFLFVPDYFIYLFTGEMICDYTIASTSQMLNPWTRSWDKELVEAVGLKEQMLLPPVLGRAVGKLRLEDIMLYSGCSHDTAAAVFGTPLSKTEKTFLILGSWIMLGMELPEPVVTDAARENDFSNEGGCNGKIRFLKNCMGMWLFQELQRCWSTSDEKVSFAQMVDWGRRVSDDETVIIDVDDPRLKIPQYLPQVIQLLCREKGEKIPDTKGEVIRCVVESIAEKIAVNKRKLELCTGEHIETLHAVGGGIKNELLCQAIANRTGCCVLAGPVEASGYGNLLTQLLGVGELKNDEEARTLLIHSVQMKRYEPN